MRQRDLERVRPVNVRALRDVVPHLVEAGREHEAVQLLEDLVFVELRCRAGQAHDLVDDMDRLLKLQTASPGARGRGALRAQPTMLASLRAFVAANLHVLRREPLLLLQQAANDARSAVRTKAREWAPQPQQGKVFWSSHCPAWAIFFVRDFSGFRGLVTSARRRWPASVLA